MNVEIEAANAVLLLIDKYNVYTIVTILKPHFVNELSSECNLHEKNPDVITRFHQQN